MQIRACTLLVLLATSCQTLRGPSPDDQLDRLWTETRFTEGVPIAKRLFDKANQSGDPNAVVRTGTRLSAFKLRAGDAQGSASTSDEVLKIAQTQLPPGYRAISDALLAAGRAKIDLGDLAGAEVDLRGALNLREQLLGSDDPSVSLVLQALATGESLRGDYAAAQAILERSLAIEEHRLGTDHPNVGATLLRLGDVLRMQGANEEAVEATRRSLAIFLKRGPEDHTDVANVYMILGAALQNLDETTKSGIYFEKALRIFEAHLGRSHPDTAGALYFLAVNSFARGQLSRAMELYAEAISSLETRFGSDHVRVGEVLLNLAKCQQISGREAEAERSYKRALTILERAYGVEHYTVGTTYHFLSGLYREQGFNQEAVYYAQKALRIFEHVLGPKHPNVGYAQISLGNSMERLGFFGEAAALYENALKIGEQGDDALTASALLAAADVQMAQGHYSRADPLVARAFELRTRLFGPDDLEVGRVWLARSDVEAGLRHSDRAEAALLRWINTAEKHLDPSSHELSVAQIDLGNFRRQQGDDLGALAHFERGIALEDERIGLTIGSLPERKQLRILRDLTRAMDSVVAFNMTDGGKTPEAGRLAFQAVLSRKGRLLEASVDQWAQARGRANQEDRHLVDELRTLRSLSAAVTYAEGLSAAERRDRVSDVEERAAQIEDALVGRLPLPHTERILAEHIYAEIPSDATLVEIVRYRRPSKGKPTGDEDRYAAYTLTNSGELHWIELGPADSIDRAVGSMRESIAHPEDARLRARARALDRKVFEPIAGILMGKRKLLISPDGSLNLVPFEALIDERGHFRIEQFRFTYLNSSRDLVRLTQGVQTEQPPVVVGAPDFSASASDPPGMDSESEPQSGGLKLSRSFGNRTFASLPGAEREAKQVASLLGVEPVLGASASEGFLKSTRAPRILHIATHAFFLGEGRTNSERSGADSGGPSDGNEVSENPLLRSGLVFAGANQLRSGREDGVLTALEASALDLAGTELLVLSACDTGLGDVHNGDGIYGLRRAFTVAGVRSQLISLWQVSDEATQELMSNFYRLLLNGAGRAEALRQVQLSMMRNPRLNSPYYWAGFVLAGDWRPMPAEQTPLGSRLQGSSNLWKPARSSWSDDRSGLSAPGPQQ